MCIPPAAKAPDKFDQLGKICWLWMNSPLQSDWPMYLASRFLLGAIETAQIHLLERDGMPVAYCSWAWLSLEAEFAYLRDPANLPDGDWHSGDRLWFIDWVAPFGARDSLRLRRSMSQRFPREVARSVRVRRHGTAARVMEFKGHALPGVTARERLDTYYRELREIAARHPQRGATASAKTDRLQARMEK